MKSVMFDTNVLISAIFSNKGNPYKAIELAVRLGYQVCICATIREEMREKFAQKWPEYNAANNALMASPFFVDIATPTAPEAEEEALRDAKDRPVYRAAASAGIDYLVTGDKDLLEFLESKIQIVTVTDFISTLKQGGTKRCE
jgi:putative PIN family toxin of toxin-antitoxin system